MFFSWPLEAIWQGLLDYTKIDWQKVMQRGLPSMMMHLPTLT